MRYREKQLPLGLDPAGPMYQYNDDPELVKIRLDKTDARLVDIIHSNAGDLNVQALYAIIQDCKNDTNSIRCAYQQLHQSDPVRVGINISTGSADFWPDGGSNGHGDCDGVGSYFSGEDDKYFILFTGFFLY